MSSKTFLSTPEAADFLGLSPRTLEERRLRGGGPLFCKMGRKVAYFRQDLIDWALERRVKSTSQVN